ncbi:MAG: ABC transporter permease [Lysobacterales bacterium]|nr:MAG: ABC transporter permease [Xanthomonadales bacterium]
MKIYRRWIRSPGAIVGLAIVAVLVGMALLAPFISPFDPTEAQLTPRFQPPSLEHLFGTDILGRDVFSRVIWGARYSLTVGVFAVTISVLVGSLMGSLMGFFYGSWIDDLGSKAIELLLSFPGIMLAIIVVTVLGPNLQNVTIAVGVMFVPRFARVVRGSSIAVSQTTFVEASRAAGATNFRIIFRHVLPNVLAPILILATMTLGESIIAAASLSFLGLGAQPPAPEWGAMLSGSRDYLRHGWWTVVAPGCMIVFAVLAINLVGDWVRDILDPRLGWSFHA